MMELEYQTVRSPKRKKLTITVGRNHSVISFMPIQAAEQAANRLPGFFPDLFVFQQYFRVTFRIQPSARDSFACV